MLVAALSEDQGLKLMLPVKNHWKTTNFKVLNHPVLNFVFDINLSLHITLYKYFSLTIILIKGLNNVTLSLLKLFYNWNAFK